MRSCAWFGAVPLGVRGSTSWKHTQTMSFIHVQHNPVPVGTVRYCIIPAINWASWETQDVHVQMNLKIHFSQGETQTKQILLQKSLAEQSGQRTQKEKDRDGKREGQANNCGAWTGVDIFLSHYCASGKGNRFNSQRGIKLWGKMRSVKVDRRKKITTRRAAELPCRC